jgi:LemA protein
MKILFLVAAVCVIGWVIFLFNRLIGLRNRAASAWSDIDVQLKRRHDLIGSLVEVVKGYAGHERSTLQELTEIRARAQEILISGDPLAAGKIESSFALRIGRLFAVVENYPALKASENFLSLHRALVDVEDHIQNARRYYNAVVRDLNTRIESFPDMLIAGLFRFRKLEFFELDSAAEAAVPRFDLEPGS